MLTSSLKSLVYYEHKSNDYVLMHSHSTYELVLYLEGTGTLGIGGECFSYEDKTMTITKPGIIHDERTKEFTKVYITLFALDEPLQKDYYCAKLSDEEFEYIKNIFDRISYEESHSLPFKAEMASRLFDLILIKFFRELSSGYETNELDITKRTKTYIKENYKQDIDFNMLSKNYGYSYDRFRHIFKEQCGTSLNQYLINYRLDKAKILLQTSDLSIKEIGYEVGFKSSAYFNNYFLKRFKITPMRFRESTKKTKVKGVCEIN